MENKIIYKQNGEIDLEGSVSQELQSLLQERQENEYNHKIRALYEAYLQELQEAEMPSYSEEIVRLHGELCDKSDYTPYITDISTKDENGEYRVVESAPFYFSDFAKYDMEVFAEELAGKLFFQPTPAQYVTGIVGADGSQIYQQHMPENADFIEYTRMLADKYGKNLAEKFFRRIMSFENGKYTETRYYTSQKSRLLEQIPTLYAEVSPLVYPQKKQTLARYLLNYAAEPDMGEDEFDINTTYAEAVKVLKMLLEEDMSVKDAIAYLEELHSSMSLIDMYSICAFLVEFGKEKGVQVYEKIFVDSAKDNKITHLDYVVADLEKVKAYIAKIRAENAEYEQALQKHVN